MRFILITLMLFVTGFASAQWTGPVDSSSNVLLKNRYVEIEATQAMFDMYNMNFDRAERHFKYLKKQYGWHPLPYFLLGLSHWWRLLPYGQQETEWDEPFLAYMDTSLYLSERLYEEVDEIEGAFFLAATYAFEGRLYAERGSYLKASNAGRNALKYLEMVRGHEDFSPEILFGDALFNYYAEWIPEHYPILKPLMALFPDGDKNLGIEQLERTARNAFYARTEAQYFLMRILFAEEGDIKGALQVSEYLHDLYPNNAYFHRYYANLNYQASHYDVAVEESLEIINRIDNQWPGYEYNSGRVAGFYLGHINELKRNFDDARKYFNYAIEYAELSNTTNKGYYYYSFLHLGRIAEREKQWDVALNHYKKVRKVTKRKNRANKEAREKIAELRKKV